jgi:hypothetical protein
MENFGISYSPVLCLIEEESLMLMSSLSVKRSHVWMGWGKRIFRAGQGAEKDRKIGPLI